MTPGVSDELMLIAIAAIAVAWGISLVTLGLRHTGSSARKRTVELHGG